MELPLFSKASWKDLSDWLYRDKKKGHRLFAYLDRVATGDVTHVSEEQFGYSEGRFSVHTDEQRQLWDFLLRNQRCTHFMREVPMGRFGFFVVARLDLVGCAPGTDLDRDDFVGRLVMASQRAVADFHGGWGGAARCVALVSASGAQLHFPDCVVDAERALKLRQAICDNCLAVAEYKIPRDMYRVIDGAVYGSAAGGPRLLGASSMNVCGECGGRAKERLKCSECNATGTVANPDDALRFHGEYDSPKSDDENESGCPLRAPRHDAWRESDEDDEDDTGAASLLRLQATISVRHEGLRLCDDWAEDPLAAPVRAATPAALPQKRKRRRPGDDAEIVDVPEVEGDRAAAIALRRGATEIEDEVAHDAVQEAVSAYRPDIYRFVHVHRIFRHERRKSSKAPRIGGDVERTYNVFVCGRGSACCMNLHGDASSLVRSHPENSIYFRVTARGISARCLCADSDCAGMTKWGRCSKYESKSIPLEARHANILFPP